MKLTGFAPEDDPVEPPLFPEIPIIDAHHHLWPTGAAIPYDREALGADIGSGHRIIATVFVECMAAYLRVPNPWMVPVGETRFVVDACVRDGHDGGTETFIAAGIVAWADLSDPMIAARTLEAHQEVAQGRFVGVRHNVVWNRRPELAGARLFPPHLLMQAPFRQSLKEVARHGLTYDVWALYEQLGELCDLADALPGLSIVLNHIGGPVTLQATSEGRRLIFDRWRHQLLKVAERPNVSVKFGGLGMSNYGFGWADRPRRPASAEIAEAWQPYFEIVLNTYGPNRVMFESNFPVDKQSFSYLAVWNAFKRLTRNLSTDERTQLFSENARRIYGLTVE